MGVRPSFLEKDKMRENYFFALTYLALYSLPVGDIKKILSLLAKAESLNDNVYFQEGVNKQQIFISAKKHLRDQVSKTRGIMRPDEELEFCLRWTEAISIVTALTTLRDKEAEEWIPFFMGGVISAVGALWFSLFKSQKFETPPETLHLFIGDMERDICSAKKLLEAVEKESNQHRASSGE